MKCGLYILVYFSLLSPIRPFAQSIDGTLIIMATCTDGIIICSDSRGSIKKNFEQLAYIDNRDKSVVVGRNVFAAWGRTFISNEPLIDMLKARRAPLSNLDPAEDLNQIAHFLYKMAGKQKFKTIRQQTHPMISGFIGEVPHFCWFGQNWDSLHCNNTFLTNHAISDSLQILMNSSTMAEVADLALEIFSSMESPAIGGPTKIVFIDSKTKTPRCVRNCNLGQMGTISQTYQNILDGNLEFKMLPPNDTTALFEFLHLQISKIKNGD